MEYIGDGSGLEINLPDQLATMRSILVLRETILDSRL